MLHNRIFTSPAQPGRAARASTVAFARHRKLVFSYLPDWITTIVLGASCLALDKVPDGNKRVFSLEDTSLRYPYTVHERVPNAALYAVCFVVPLLVQLVVNVLTIRSWWDFHNGSLGLVLGLAITGLITQLTKITVGRPRPDIINRCQPPAGSVDPPFGLIDSTICTQKDVAILLDGFRSFPSGHASLSFAGLGFLALYLAGKLHLFDHRGNTAKAWLALSPYAVATLVGVSRTMDYRHHWHDVFVGSLVGICVSYFTYRQYYPTLASELSHRPYSPRIQRDDVESLPIHHHRPSSPGLDYPLPSQSSHLEAHGQSGGYSPLGSDLHLDARESFIDYDYDLQGTVMRLTPPPLQEIWRDGEREHSVERKVPIWSTPVLLPRETTYQRLSVA